MRNRPRNAMEGSPPAKRLRVSAPPLNRKKDFAEDSSASALSKLVGAVALPGHNHQKPTTREEGKAGLCGSLDSTVDEDESSLEPYALTNGTELPSERGAPEDAPPHCGPRDDPLSPEFSPQKAGPGQNSRTGDFAPPLLEIVRADAHMSRGEIQADHSDDDNLLDGKDAEAAKGENLAVDVVVADLNTDRIAGSFVGDEEKEPTFYDDNGLDVLEGADLDSESDESRHGQISDGDLGDNGGGEDDHRQVFLTCADQPLLGVVGDDNAEEGRRDVTSASGYDSDEEIELTVLQSSDEDDRGLAAEDAKFVSGSDLHDNVDDVSEDSDDDGGDDDDDDDGDNEDLSSEDEDCDRLMQYILSELNDSPDKDPTSVLAGILRERGMELEDILPGMDGFKPVSLHVVVKALVSHFRVQPHWGIEGLQRQPVVQVKGMDDVVELVRRSRRVLVLSGAGVSVSCGIPDFRSPGGLYDTVRDRFGLDEPHALFDIHYFQQNPVPFFTFAKEIFPGGNVKPSIAHRFVRALEDGQQLLRNYTQNIDGLEFEAGVKRVIACHGSFATATCRRCKRKVLGECIREKILSNVIPECETCVQQMQLKNGEDDLREAPILKPDIVFFGEPLVDAFFNHVNEDLDGSDLMIVMGTSLKVAPVSRLPALLPNSTPRILINRELVGTMAAGFDVELLGDCDVILNELMKGLGWSSDDNSVPMAAEPRRVGEKTFAFEGAKLPPHLATAVAAERR